MILKTAVLILGMLISEENYLTAVKMFDGYSCTSPEVTLFVTDSNNNFEESVKEGKIISYEYKCIELEFDLTGGSPA